MQMELDGTEAQTLRTTLEVYVSELRHEWSRTEDHDYRRDLLRTMECLERIILRLQGSALASAGADAH